MHQLLSLKWNHKVLPWRIIEHEAIRASQGYLVIGWSHLDLVLNHRIEYLGCNTEAICTSSVQLPLGYESQTIADTYCLLYNAIQLASHGQSLFLCRSIVTCSIITPTTGAALVVWLVRFGPDHFLIFNIANSYKSLYNYLPSKMPEQKFSNLIYVDHHIVLMLTSIT